MSDHEPFLCAIAAQPESQTPRLIYADWLEERGDARAEFIRLHVRLAEQPDDEEFFRLLEREQAIRPHIDPAWLKTLGYDEAYPRLFRLDEGLWLEDSQAMLRWGIRCHEAAAIAASHSMRESEHWRFISWNASIWRGLSATVTVGFPQSADEENGSLRNLMVRADSHAPRKKWTKKAVSGFQGVTSANFADYLAEFYTPRPVKRTGIELLIQRFGAPTHHDRQPREIYQWEWSFAELRLHHFSKYTMYLQLQARDAPQV